MQLLLIIIKVSVVRSRSLSQKFKYLQSTHRSEFQKRLVVYHPPAVYISFVMKDMQLKWNGILAFLFLIVKISVRKYYPRPGQEYQKTMANVSLYSVDMKLSYNSKNSRKLLFNPNLCIFENMNK